MARRGPGEGSIYRRVDGRWCARVTIAFGGKRRYIYGRTRQEVAGKLTAALKAVGDGIPMPGEGTTVGAFLDDWLLSQKHRLGPRTWSRYEQYVRLNAKPALGRLALTKLTPSHLQRLYSDRLEAGSSTTTVHHLHAVLHKALGQAMRQNLVARNVADLVEPPRMRRFEMVVLSPEQASILLDALTDTPIEAIVTLALTTGMRRGELLALRWRDVDLDRHVLSVCGTLQRLEKKLVVTEPKTRRSRRQVELTRIAVEALRRHRTAQLEQRLLVGSGWGERDFVFATAWGQPQEGHDIVHKHFQPLLERAGLPRLRFHDLRHTAATLMLGRRVHPKVVSEMLGHATIAITLDLYSHVTDTMQREATREMDALLGRAD